MSTRENRKAIKIGGGLAMLAGLGAVLALTAYQGFAEVGRILMSAGWVIAIVGALHLITGVTLAMAWRTAARAAGESRGWVFLWARLVRDAVNGLLPVAQIGGNVVGARILTFHGSRLQVAGASVVADMTLELVTQIAFTLVGLCLLLVNGGGAMTVGAVIGFTVAVLAATGFVLAQRWGFFRLLEKFLDRIGAMFNWPDFGSRTNLHDTVMTIYRNPAAVAAGAAWHMTAWFLHAVQVWLALFMLGADVSFADALVIESLVQALRSAAFLVPGAYGVQEGGYMVLGAHYGIPPEVGLSLSLIMRFRDLALGVPAILVWQVLESRRLLGVAAGVPEKRS